MRSIAFALLLLVSPLACGAEVYWLPEYAAWQAPGPMLVHVSRTNCRPCEVEASFFHDSGVVTASRSVNCTALSWPRDAARIAAYRVDRFPTDIIVAANRRDITARYVGCPASPAELAARLEPANLPPEGPQHSILTEEWICDQNGCHRVPSPGPIGRLNFRPSPLLRRVR
jgi:hypothetical protein